jgi:hypothetical protein
MHRLGWLLDARGYRIHARRLANKKMRDLDCRRITPAMAAGVTNRLWTLEELVDHTSV